MTYPKPHSKLVAGLEPEFISNASPGQPGALFLLSMLNKWSSRGRRGVNMGMDGQDYCSLVSSRPGPCSCRGWVTSARRKAAYVTSVLLLGAFSDFWTLPSANFHSVGFRKPTICCMASKLTSYKLEIKYKKMKVKLIKEIFCPLEVDSPLDVHSSQLR